MPLPRLILAAAAVALFSTGAFAADTTPQCPPRPGFALFTPEVRMMMLADLKAQAEAGAVDIDMLRQMQRDKLKAMSEDQRKAYADGLTKRWNALTPAQQMQMKADALKWRAEHPRPEGQGRPDCRPKK